VVGAPAYVLMGDEARTCRRGYPVATPARRCVPLARAHRDTTTRKVILSLRNSISTPTAAGMQPAPEFVLPGGTSCPSPRNRIRSAQDISLYGVN
jgi:hypothetical protein